MDGDQPQLHTWHSGPSADVCFVPIIWFVVVFIPGSVTGLSSAPALVDSRGVFLFGIFIAINLLLITREVGIIGQYYIILYIILLYIVYYNIILLHIGLYNNITITNYPYNI